MSQPPVGPPHGPPPYGYYPAPPPQPEPGNNWHILWGAVTGFLATVVLPFASFGLAASTGISVFLMSFLLVPCVGFALLFSATTRAWGTGLLIGWGISLLVAAGACVALLSGLQ
jgi:hypothetical protein